MKIIRLIIIFVVELLLALLVHQLVYNNFYSYENVSNSLFVVGIILFLPTVAVVTRAYEVFQGFSYAIRILFSPSYKDQYPKFSDFKESRSIKFQMGIFYEIIISSAILIIMAGIYSGLAMR